MNLKPGKTETAMSGWLVCSNSEDRIPTLDEYMEAHPIFKKVRPKSKDGAVEETTAKELDKQTLAIAELMERAAEHAFQQTLSILKTGESLRALADEMGNISVKARMRLNVHYYELLSDMVSQIKVAAKNTSYAHDSGGHDD